MIRYVNSTIGLWILAVAELNLGTGLGADGVFAPTVVFSFESWKVCNNGIGDVESGVLFDFASIVTWALREEFDPISSRPRETRVLHAATSCSRAGSIGGSFPEICGALLCSTAMPVSEVIDGRLFRM